MSFCLRLPPQKAAAFCLLGMLVLLPSAPAFAIGQAWSIEETTPAALLPSDEAYETLTAAEPPAPHVLSQFAVGGTHMQWPDWSELQIVGGESPWRTLALRELAFHHGDAEAAERALTTRDLMKFYGSGAPR
jgi:hypothetical protein